jgi:hypothetical protein
MNRWMAAPSFAGASRRSVIATGVVGTSRIVRSPAAPERRIRATIILALALADVKASGWFGKVDGKSGRVVFFH